jgi:hypothetical protein
MNDRIKNDLFSNRMLSWNLVGVHFRLPRRFTGTAKLP